MPFSTLPEIVRQRLDDTSELQDALQNPNFDVRSLTYHLPRPSSSGSFGSWSLHGSEYDFRLYGQLSAQQTFLGPYGDMLYHKAKARYSGPWSQMDVLRGKKKISLVLPDVPDLGPHGRTLCRQYEHLNTLQQLDYAEATADLPVEVRQKSGFVIRTSDRWRLSCVSDNIFHRHLPHGHDGVHLLPEHDPQGIVAKLFPATNTGPFVRQPDMIDASGRTVPVDKVADVFRAGCWVEVYCKLRVWLGRDGEIQTRSYHVVFDAVQFLCAGTVKEGAVRTDPVVTGKRKREFTSVLIVPEKRARTESTHSDT